MQPRSDDRPNNLNDRPNNINDMPTIDERTVQRNSEAFLNTATKITEDMLPPEHSQSATQPAQPTPIEKARVNSGLNLGPKYLSALTQLDTIQDTKAISVQLPMSLKKVEITSVTGAEEQALKSASVSPETFLKKINELLYNHVTYVDGFKPTFSEFLDSIYPPDKATLIWGFLSSSYVVLPDLERECTSCGKNYIVKSTPNDLIHHDTFIKTWDKSLSPAEYTVKQETFDGFITFEFGIPTEKDRLLITGMLNPDGIKDNISKEGSLLSQADILIFFTRSITVGEPGSQTILTDLAQDIYPFIRNLSPKIADGVRSETDLTIFDDYMPNFYIESTCSHCATEQKAETDVELTFFRKSLAI